MNKKFPFSEIDKIVYKTNQGIGRRGNYYSEEIFVIKRDLTEVFIDSISSQGPCINTSSVVY